MGANLVVEHIKSHCFHEKKIKTKLGKLTQKYLYFAKNKCL